MKGFLESAEIPCNIPEEHLGTIVPTYGPAMTFRVQVPEVRLQEAQELLAQQKTEAAAEADRCTRCGTLLEERPTQSKNWYRALLGLFLGVPMRRETHKVCPVCEPRPKAR